MNPVSQDPKRVDVLIGGAGFAGLALSIALRQALGPSFAVTVADPALGREASDARASAIVAAARRLFETIGVWERVADEAQPILDMVITDSRLTDAVRPTFLTFAGGVEQRSQVDEGRADLPAFEPFAHMIENGPLLAALGGEGEGRRRHATPPAVVDFCLSSPQSLVGDTDRASTYPPPASDSERWGGSRASSEAKMQAGWGVSGSREPPTPNPSPPLAALAGGGEFRRRGLSNCIEVEFADGERVAARLLVAADGARSTIRERAGIASHGWTYDQSSIVTTVAHERDHEGRAEEHFLPAGPFAILPLKHDPVLGHRSSIVWTEDKREAERIVALPDAEFHAELERRFGLHLGEIKAVGPRRAFRLGLSVAREFVAERLALVGDAAHVIHPIAGQGLNMGLKDVAALAEVIVDAARLGLDPGSLATLDRYQRWRRFDTMAMGVATDGLNRLFSNRSDVLRLFRDVGLGLVDRLPGLKQLFIREAAGLVGEVPKLLRGEAL